MIGKCYKRGFSIRYLLLSIAVCLVPLKAFADEPRVALVIGNSGYANSAILPNAIGDASLIQNALSRVGFDVQLVENLRSADSSILLDAFSERAERAEIALIYYAGHGMALSGENYLIPVDADVNTEQRVIDTSISLARLQEAVARASNFGVVLFDACQTNPWIDDIGRIDGTQGTTTGLAGGVPILQDVIVGFSAQPGQVAYDGAADNGPYAVALSEVLQRSPDMEIAPLLRHVSSRVQEITGNRQDPVHSENLSPVFTAFTRMRQAEVEASPLDLGGGMLSATPEGVGAVSPVEAFTAAAVLEVTECDRQAGYTWRPRVDGVGRPWDEIDPEVALNACRAAIVDYPEEPFFYLLAARAVARQDLDDPRVLTYVRRGATADAGFGLDRMAWLAFHGGSDIPPNRDAAFMLALLAAESGYTNSLINVGDMFRDEAPADTDRALQLYQLAQAAGLPEASAKIAWHMMQFGPAEPDYLEVRALYEVAEAAGIAWATNNLGSMDRRGEGIAEPSPLRALVRYERACNLGNFHGCRNAGDVLTRVPLMSEENFVRAEGFYRTACDNGNAQGCFGLGWLHGNGHLPDADPELATTLYTSACEDDVGGACNNLARLLDTPDSGEANIIEVATLWEKSCDLGDQNGCHNFARRLEEYGEIVRPDMSRQDIDVEALTRYEAACSGGSSSACNGLGRTYWNADLGVERNYETAAEYYLRGCTLGSNAGCLNRARLARYGHITIDEEPLDIMEAHCDDGHARSCRYLGEFLTHDAYDIGTEAAFRTAHGVVEHACAMGQAESCTYLVFPGPYFQQWNTHSRGEYFVQIVDLDGDMQRMAEWQQVTEEELLATLPNSVAAEVQAALAERGLYAGSIDGLFGAQSRAALAALMAQ